MHSTETEIKELDFTTSLNVDTICDLHHLLDRSKNELFQLDKHHQVRSDPLVSRI